VERLQAAGAIVSHGTVPSLTRAYDLAAMLFTADAYAWWRPLVEAAPEKMFPQILERVRGGAAFAAADYLAGWAELAGIRADYAAATAGFDAVIMPTAPILPPNVRRLETDDTYYKVQNLAALRNTRAGNLMGLCGLTLPTGVPSCGILFNAAPMAEARLLRMGAAAEAALA
jgi:aspartyl-tRNA(Asn)/glutamyl-tRNA(Gln) amidotransferase subunit A